MTVDDAIRAIYINIVTTISVYLHDVPVYKYARLSHASGSYIVVNALPIGSGMLQKCTANVNIYCDDIFPGSPDAVKLTDMTNAVIGALDNSQNMEGDVLIYFQQQCVFRDEELKSHYSNIRFDIRLINN
jgi:hypothetical protein